MKRQMLELACATLLLLLQANCCSAQSQSSTAEPSETPTSLANLSDNSFDTRSFEIPKEVSESSTADGVSAAPSSTSGYPTALSTSTGQHTSPTGTQTSPHRRWDNARGTSGPSLPRTSLATMGSIAGFLPPTTMDSFVYNAAGMAELIYGDEGTNGPPPYEGFTPEHYIGSGIYSIGLTTGHASLLPSAWGYPQ